MEVHTLLDSLRYAWAGLVHAVATERNMRIHCLVAVMTFFLGYKLGFSPLELALLALTSGAVLAAEMFNTAVERAVDLVTDQYDPLAETAKNVAAGAVLITALTAVVVGGMLFLARLARFY